MTSPSLVPPAAVRAAFRDGVELVRAGYGGKGLRPETVDEARAIGWGRGPVAVEKVRRMVGWFHRHAVDRRPGWEARRTPGWVAWQAWGGDAGRAWAERTRAALVRAGRLPPIARPNPRAVRRRAPLSRYPTLPAALAAAVARSPYASHGLRVTDDPAEARVGNRLGPSRRWIDGAPTDEVLDGTSALGFSDARSARRACCGRRS